MTHPNLLDAVLAEQIRLWLVERQGTFDAIVNDLTAELKPLIVEDLKQRLAQKLAAPASAEADRLRDELDRLRKAFVESNNVLRSCYSVFERHGDQTNWEALIERLVGLLEVQRLMINQWGGFKT